MGLTATGLSHSSVAEKYFLSTKFGLLNISAGISSNIDKEVKRAADISSFLSMNDEMAKLIYMGEDSKWLSKMIDLGIENHDLDKIVNAIRVRLKVSFQNEFMRSSFLPKCQPKI